MVVESDTETEKSGVPVVRASVMVVESETEINDTGSIVIASVVVLCKFAAMRSTRRSVWHPDRARSRKQMFPKMSKL